MKKILVLMLAVVMALSVVAFVACSNTKTVTGEYKYENTYGDVADDYYGIKVKVTVSGNKITKVEAEADTDKLFNSSKGSKYETLWKEKEAAFLKSFEGKTVEEVKAIKAEFSADHNTATTDYKFDGLIVGNNTGATQSATRAILAIQNALTKLGK